MSVFPMRAPNAGEQRVPSVRLLFCSLIKAVVVGARRHPIALEKWWRSSLETFETSEHLKWPWLAAEYFLQCRFAQTSTFLCAR